MSLDDYNVRIAESSLDIAKIKSIDDMAFVGHRGISEEELVQVKECGALLILYHVRTGYVVGEAQLLFKAIPEIPHKFEFPTGYCYGVAIRPAFQAHGLGKILMRSVWDVATEHSIEEIHLSVRIENYPSLKLMFQQGYKIFDYRKDFYGPSKVEGPRLMMNRTHDRDKNVRKGFFVAVSFNSFDEKAHKLIAEHIARGRVGVGVTHEGLYFA